MTRREARTAAEWVSFAAACAVLAVVAVLVAVQAGEQDAPAAPVVAAVEAPRRQGGLYYVAADVQNHGGQTATNVQVTAELRIGDDTLTGDQVVDFIAAGETETVVFSFPDDPATGELTIEVASYTEP